ncbi:MAG: class I SAM-dependent methyltransferase, partial [Thermoplasmatota archaeon]
MAPIKFRKQMEKRYEIIRVRKERGQEVLDKVKDEGILDPDRLIIQEKDELIIPVTRDGNDIQEDIVFREKSKTPYEKIKEHLDLDESLKELLPNRWEVLGNILLIKLPEGLIEYKERIGEVYAEVLGAKTVLLQGWIEGIKRKPKVELIYGEETETIHIENCIQYKMDTSKLMFSSGNIDERIRMANIDIEGEIIVDMFAGIGYFTLPMAYHGNPDTIHSLEINPISYEYLKENIKLNEVKDTVLTWNGDNRDFYKKDFADRIVMGYLHNTWKYLHKALDFLNDTGIIHYHTLADDENYPSNVKNELKENIDKEHTINNLRKIKSYAPHVFHVVA